MSSIKKQININPDLFKVGGRERKKKDKKTRKQKEANFNVISPNKAKKTLIEKIREHRRNKTMKKNLPEKSDNFKNEFNDSMNYLNNLVNETPVQENTNNKNLVEDNQPVNIPNANTNITNRESLREERNQINRIHNKTLKSHHNYYDKNYESDTKINLSMPNDLNNLEKTEINVNSILPDQPYGCLKGGTKPTYRNWLHSTRKNIENNKPNLIVHDEHNFNKELHSRQAKLKELKTENEKKKPVVRVNEEVLNNFDEKMKILNKKTFKKKYKLGRSKKNRTISILLKGFKQKEKVQDEYKKILNDDIKKMKKYLKKRGILKTGSTAPNDVIRQMYSSTILSGSVNNLNKDILMHNFLNDDI
jgi:hypothetical protein